MSNSVEENIQLTFSAISQSLPCFPHSHLCGSSRCYLRRFYNCREPQESANIPRKPRRNRIDRNQNTNLRSATFRKTTAAFCRQRYAQNRRERRLEPHKWKSGIRFTSVGYKCRDITLSTPLGFRSTKLQTDRLSLEP